MSNRPPKASLWRSLRNALFVVVAIVIYAYATQKTQVDFAQIRDPRRLESLTRVLRALADPDLFFYDTLSQSATARMFVPCVAGQSVPETPRVSGQPYVQLSKPCAAKNENVQAEGFGFHPGGEGTIEVAPENAPSRLVGSIFSADGSGHFVTTFPAPTISETLPVSVTATVKWTTGEPRATTTLTDTIDKIIETVFLALMATTFGVLLAVPLSFLASRNIMAPITTPLGGLVAALLAAPFGAYAGWWLFGLLSELGLQWSANALQGFVLLVVLVAALYGTLYLSGFSRAADVQLSFPQARRLFGGAALIVELALMLSLAGGFARNLGGVVQPMLGTLSFLGYFLKVVGDALNVFLPVLGAVIGLVVFSTAAQSLLAHVVLRASAAVGKLVSCVLAGLAAAVIVGLVFAALAWLRAEPALDLAAFPALIAGLVAAVLTLFVPATRSVPIGNLIYYATRTFFNVVRAVEPLIYGIVFVIWVGLGPFAGTLALTLHSIAVLGKLYSEQVENILPGPIEAITATGANRLQTVVYAVIPQIVAPFVSLTLYRWDVNVRSSTILGFVGGGGIGFILQQNVNLLRYRSAATQMIAIAIVVIILDYVSARVREKYV